MNNTLSPVYVGDTRLWSLPQVNRDGTPTDLTNIVLPQGAYVVLQQTQPVATNLVGTGTVAILTPATAGNLTYHPSAADVATPGNYRVWMMLNFGGDWDHGEPIDLLIEDAPPHP